jgi:hypothetical protein
MDYRITGIDPALYRNCAVEAKRAASMSENGE